MRLAMLMLMLMLLASCTKEASPALSLYGSTVFPASGAAVGLTVSAIDPTGRPGAGEVRLSSPSGLGVPASVELVDGLASFEVHCQGCSLPATLEATWSGRTASKSFTLDRAAASARPPAPVEAAPARRVDQDDQPPGFSCGGWDGGVRAGYTQPDGGPLAVGCDGERIDVVFIESESPTKVSVCGTLELAEPATDPVYLRAELSGVLRLKGSMQMCCGDFRCLSQPTGSATASTQSRGAG